MRTKFIVVLFLCASSAWAHPVSYQGALSVMTWNQPYLNDFWTTYSYLPNAAVAARCSMVLYATGGFFAFVLPRLTE